jgi:hypothetical protein
MLCDILSVFKKVIVLVLKIVHNVNHLGERDGEKPDAYNNDHWIKQPVCSRNQ